MRVGSLADGVLIDAYNISESVSVTDLVIYFFWIRDGESHSLETRFRCMTAHLENYLKLFLSWVVEQITNS